MITDWDDAYANRDHIPGADEFIGRWEGAAAKFRKLLAGENRIQEDIVYGFDSRERLDLLMPKGKPAGLVVFVHGGYWRAFDKSSWSHFAKGALRRGWAFAVPSYVLCPKFRIAEITRRIAHAIERAAEHVGGRIRLVGHSAGGHLVTRMGCRDGILPSRIRARIEKTLSISGVHDLRPLLHTKMNADFRLDLEEAEVESPALLTPTDGVDLVCWAGGDERPEFIRQTRLLASAWTGCAARTQAIIEPGKHHFDVIDGLADADSEMCDILLN